MDYTEMETKVLDWIWPKAKIAVALFALSWIILFLYGLVTAYLGG